MTTTNARMQQRRDSAADWTSADPVLAAGEIGYETDTGLVKFGNGSDAWSALSYLSGGGGGVLRASQFSTLLEALTAFASADEKVLEFDSDASYTISSPIAVTFTGTERTIKGNGATIITNVGFGETALDFGASEKLTVSGFNVEQSVPQSSFAMAAAPTTDFVRFRDNKFTGCYLGLRLGGGGPEAPIYCTDNHLDDCDYGIYSFGDYAVIQGNVVKNSSIIGVYAIQGVTTGNMRITGNTIVNNVIGIKAENLTRAVRIDDNTINHNSTCGIYVFNNLSVCTIANNEISANYGGAALGAGIKNSQFGIYVEDSVRTNIIGNTLGVNKFSIALDGIVDSKITNNEFFGLSDLTTTTDHLKEIGGTNDDYIVDNNTFSDYLISGHTDLATNCPGATLGTNQVTHQTS